MQVNGKAKVGPRSIEMSIATTDGWKTLNMGWTDEEKEREEGKSHLLYEIPTISA